LKKEQLIQLLQAQGENRETLLTHAQSVKLNEVGNKVYFRGLIEFSNICSKNCFYCGIRKGNRNVIRYDISDQEILDACQYAWEQNFGSVVLQSGELSSPEFVNRVDHLLRKIKQLSNNELGITLSCGEQSFDTYQRWFESGAHRYLLRIESSNRELYYKIHPNNENHSFEKRIEALFALKKSGYQVGTGVMIGLPFQTYEDLANDLLFFKQLDIDMCGMGPYIEHEQTPLFQHRHLLKSKKERFDLAINMIASLRLLMPDINIAAATALQAIDTQGYKKALRAGANVFMPNITPGRYRKDYFLYENKPFYNENDLISDFEIGVGQWGDSPHFLKKENCNR
jgi:biotin synthase